MQLALALAYCNRRTRPSSDPTYSSLDMWCVHIVLFTIHSRKVIPTGDYTRGPYPKRKSRRRCPGKHTQFPLQNDRHINIIKGEILYHIIP